MAFCQEIFRGFPAIIPFCFPGVPNVFAGFTTGLYGNISLESGLAGEEGKKRRAALAQLLGFENWTELRQVHGDVLLSEPPATSFEAPSSFEADGLATSRPLQAMLVKAADCQQILMAHRSGKYVAALHCGWRGNVLNFPGSGLRSFCQAYALAPCDVLAVRGPSLGPGAAEFINFESEWPSEFQPWFNSRTKRMDLWSLTRQQLIEAGMLPENIFSIDLCTHTLCNFLYSYRRGHAERQAALIFIKEDNYAYDQHSQIPWRSQN